MWKNIFPPLQWIKGYSPKHLQSDAFAGITLAAYAIPVSMAYASLAGLPVQYGIYGYLIGGIFYAIFGTGRQLAIGPASAISLLIGTTIATIANGDVQRWEEIASLTALVMAVMSLLAYLLHFNSVVNFIRESALIGFKAGAAITIVLTQFPKLFGIPGGGNGFFERAGILIGQLPETNLKVLVFGILKGVVLAAIVSILLLLRALANPSVTFLGRIPGTKRYGDISRHPDNETIPGLLLIRVEASLFYFIIENIRSSVWAEIQKSESTLKCIIWDLSTSAYVDIAGARFIKKLYLELKAKEISLKIAEAHSRVRDMLRSEGIEELLGHISRRTSVDDLVKEYEGNQY